MAEIRNWNPPKITPSAATFSWGNSEVDYASSVYFGESYVGGDRGFARPWVDVTLPEYDWEEVFWQNYDGNPWNLGEAFQGCAEDMGEAFKRTIDYYDWGVEGQNQKRVRAGNTWRYITDSGALRDSQEITYSDD